MLFLEIFYVHFPLGPKKHLKLPLSLTFLPSPSPSPFFCCLSFFLSLSLLLVDINDFFFPQIMSHKEVIVENDEMEDGSIFVCFMCEKEFRKVSLLNEHMQMHQNMPGNVINDKDIYIYGPFMYVCLCISLWLSVFMYMHDYSSV